MPFCFRDRLVRRSLCLLLFAISGPLIEVRAEEESVRYRVQLVRGSEGVEAPTATAKPIGVNLTKKLQAVFRWQRYWEINRLTVVVPKGGKKKVRLSKEREAEIDLTVPQKRTVIVYKDSRALTRSIKPLSETLTIVGGDRDADSAWFIVVRREKAE